ncbi:MAG: MoxR family ATPase [Cytophagales bacterium]|nr:MoxR family ATPase [Cytophagales bacterium]
MENNEQFASRIDLSQLKDSVAAIKSEIARVIVGQDKMIELLLTAILADGHVLLEGVPGVAKTLTAKLIAKIVDVDFSRIQFTPDLMPSDILGTSVFNVKTSEFEFKSGPIFANIVLIDEINRAPAKTQAALFEVMEERQVSIDGQRFAMNPPFITIATQNPIDQEGTYRLPEAQLDRFLFKISVGYPSLEEEILIIEGEHGRKEDPVASIKTILSGEEIADYRQKVAELHVERNLMKYIAEIVHETRQNKSLYLGASPRASLGILGASKALAAIRGRDFVVPEDIKEVTFPVLGHRLLLTPEKEMEGLGTAQVIDRIIDKIEVPR